MLCSSLIDLGDFRNHVFLLVEALLETRLFCQCPHCGSSQFELGMPSLQTDAYSQYYVQEVRKAKLQASSRITGLPIEEMK